MYELEGIVTSYFEYVYSGQIASSDWIERQNPIIENLECCFSIMCVLAVAIERYIYFCIGKLRTLLSITCFTLLQVV